ncbi:RHS repeat-associated core domain-containing protein [Chitinivorax sp. B]|uniref:RHS repeat-associated core domain-containing protein n=1 Tax=Chitinivorax sp. B TaxID=2502235 RepID=UPI0010F5B216|nr:RHS repeat-associated core domain-containing protein [Chitinivorax sp. B]
MSNAQGMLQAWQQFDAWGNRLNGQGDIPQYGYTGREPDVAGLIYYRARWYDPSIGRFTQRDPSGLAGGLNPYAYVDGDPINLIDPSGLTSAKPQPVRQTSYVNSPLAVQPGKQMLTSMMANFEARQVQDSQAALDRAQSAADHWVQKQQETGNPLYAIPGVVASALANPDTINRLAMVLSIRGAGPKGLPVHRVSKSATPEIAANTQRALDQGKPSVLTRIEDRSQIRQNRRDALRGQPAAGPGRSLDEYPFASCAQGGAGACVASVPSREQNIQGGQLSNFYQQNNIRAGDRFKVEVVD